MMNTLNIDWLDTITLDGFIRMINKNDEYKHERWEVENSDRIPLPMFNKVFDDCCRGLGRIPTQEEYASYYAYKAEDVIKEYGLDIDKVKNRARRNIFSFIQEYGIYIVLRENNIEGLYDRVWDGKGIDFIINQKGTTTGLCVIADTPSAYYYTKLKNKFRRNGITFKTFSLITRSDLSIKHNGIKLLPNMDAIRKCLVSNKIG